MKVFDSVLDLIGNTPIVKLNRVINDTIIYNKVNIFVKLEYFNPSNSVKDRAAYNMILTAENNGLINNNTTIIEATSGNTGIALATICAARGYRLILVIPDTMSIDKIHHIQALGAEVVLTPGILGMKKAFAVRRSIRNPI